MSRLYYLEKEWLKHNVEYMKAKEEWVVAMKAAQKKYHDLNDSDECHAVYRAEEVAQRKYYMLSLQHPGSRKTKMAEEEYYRLGEERRAFQAKIDQAGKECDDVWNSHPKIPEPAYNPQEPPTSAANKIWAEYEKVRHNW